MFICLFKFTYYPIKINHYVFTNDGENKKILQIENKTVR